MKWLDKIPVEKIKKSANELALRSIDRHIKIAVTGLSRSGKTAFITSLVQQLLNIGANQHHRLPFFKVANSERWLGARRITQQNLHVPAFPYESSLEAIAAEPPAWPPSTQGLSETRLAIRFKPANFIEQKISHVATMYLDIIDYPGEWLLDLPLLDWDFKQWSDNMGSLLENGPRLQLSEAWRMQLSRFSAEAVIDESSIKELAQNYRRFLLASREEQHGLSIIQPGRFILPGDLEGAPVLDFCPLPGFVGDEANTKGWPEDCLYNTMKTRYEHYKQQVVKPFYKNYFKQFDRQIVLVDCLHLLNHGPDSFKDAQRAVNMILSNFNYGRSSILKRLFSPKIDRLVFAASKADCVTPNQHHNLKMFLQAMVSEANNDARFEGVKTEAMSLAAINSTQIAQSSFQGQAISCLKGRLKSNGEEIAIFPGEIPVDIPVRADWEDERFNFVEFEPPRDLLLPGQALPHIRMDQALEYLLGDKF